MKRLPFLLIVGGLASVPGCGNDGLVPAKGKVSFDGAPVANASLTFFDTSEGAGLGYGSTDAGGLFSISSGGGKGINPGKYKVTVVKTAASDGDAHEGGKRSPEQRMELAEKNAIDLLPKIYGKAATTPLEVEVPSGGAKNLELSLVSVP